MIQLTLTRALYGGAPPALAHGSCGYDSTEEEEEEAGPGRGGEGLLADGAKEEKKKDGLNEICSSKEGFKVHVLTVSDLLTLSAARDS